MAKFSPENTALKKFDTGVIKAILTDVRYPVKPTLR